MAKINLNIITEKDGFERLSETEARKWVMDMIMNSLDRLSEEFTPGEMKLSILDQLTDKLNKNKELSISTVESVCLFIDCVINATINKDNNVVAK